MATQASHFEYDGFAQIEDKLKAMALDNPELKEYVRKATWAVLGEVRKAVQANANFRNSKHNSIQAVRRSVYKKILGGSVSILDGKKSKRKANSGSFTKTGQSERTQQINAYSGDQRGFILRFVNSGTQDRYAGGRNYTTKMKKYIEKNGPRAAGWRGAITPRNFFSPAANSEIQSAADKLAEMIDQEIAKQFNNG